MVEHPLFLCYPLFQSKIRVSKPIQRTYHLNQQGKIKKKTYGTEINRSAYHDELYLFDTTLST
jgi:hypothetical protein